MSNLGATVINTHRITYIGAFAFEALGTFFLINTVLHTAVRRNASRLAPVAIGMTVTICILGFGVLTGGSVNPARTIGPAVAAAICDGIFVYLAAQVVGKKLAEEAKSKGITKAAFDRGHYRYHGRIKALADAAREGGLKF